MTKPPKLIAVDTPAGTRRYSRRARAFLKNMQGGMNIELAALSAKISARQGYRIWNWPETKSAVRQAALDTLARGAPVAANKVMELIAGDNKHVALKAAELALGTQAIAKPPAASIPAPTVNVGIFGVGEAGYVIHTKAQRLAYETLMAEGAVNPPGYVIDWSEPDEGTRGRASAARRDATDAETESGPRKLTSSHIRPVGPQPWFD